MTVSFTPKRTMEIPARDLRVGIFLVMDTERAHEITEISGRAAPWLNVFTPAGNRIYHVDELVTVAAEELDE